MLTLNDPSEYAPMSNDSDGSKNDPLFERLFAEAEACLDRSKQTQKDVEDGGEMPTESASEEAATPSTVKPSQVDRLGVEKSNRDKVDALKMGLSLRAQPASPQNVRRVPTGLNAGRRPQQGPNDEALKNAEAKIEKLQGRLTTIKDRAKRDQQMALSKQSDKMLITILELLDDLERALVATVEPESDSAQFKAYRAGIKQVYDGGQQTLNHYGVRKFDAESEPFDPSLHEAVRREPRADLEPNRVAEVFQTGYLIEERLLRAARVSVSVPE